MKPEDAHQLGLLVRFGLDPRTRPSHNADYRRLVQRMQRDAAFATAFEDLAAGMGLFVLSADDYGVVFGCRDDSPFAMRVVDFRSGMKADDRLVYGLVLLALASYCFPRAADLDEFGEGVRRVGVSDLTGYLVELSERLAETREEDAEADHPELEAAWRAVLRVAASKPTASGRRSATTLAGKVKYTLELLAKRGLLVPHGKERFKTTRALRTQLREMTANEAFELVRAAAPAVEEA